MSTTIKEALRAVSPARPDAGTDFAAKSNGVSHSATNRADSSQNRPGVSHSATGKDRSVSDDPLADTYYDAARREYLAKNGRGAWLRHDVANFKRILRQRGFHSRPAEDKTISQIDEAILTLQDTRDVDYAGPLAGYAEGFCEENGARFLVTAGPRLIEPVPGSWPMLTRLLAGLFDHPGEVDQCPYVFGWLKMALEALRAGKRRPGQALVLAGPRNCGKSLFQNLLTLLLGGRAAKPYRYMSGGTDFNGDLFAAEHLMMEDEEPRTDLAARRNLGARIKEITVNELQSCHAKHRDALGLRPFWRLTVSLNDEAENLLVLPPLDDSLADKLMLLQVRRPEMPMPTADLAARTAFWERLVSELPAFVNFLLHEWDAPGELRCARFGVTHYHHPALLEAIGALTPQRRLLELIDGELFGAAASPPQWEDTAAELERVLTGAEAKMAHEARRLFGWPAACGVYLSRLAAEYPERVRERRVQGRRLWTIRTPDHAEEENNP